MKLLEAYLEGWRVLLRVGTFVVCLALFALPFALALWSALRLQESLLKESIGLVAFFGLLPLGTYLASWYSGEFRAPKGGDQQPEPARRDEELW